MRVSKSVLILLMAVVFIKAMIDMALLINAGCGKKMDKEGVTIEITVSKSWFMLLPEKFFPDV